MPRKELDDEYTVYASREFDVKSIWTPILSDFGLAVSGEVEPLKDVQPDIYRPPEVCLMMPRSYRIDIWNVGIMVYNLELVRRKEYVLWTGPQAKRLEGSNKVDFLQFMRKMLQWRLEDRQTARQLLEDPWLDSR